jgi:hypothetical protein
MPRRSSSKRATGLNPLGYMGVEATTPAQLIQIGQNPTAQQNEFNIGTTWINDEVDRIWILTNLNGGTATWTEVGFSPNLTVNCDAGSAVETGNAISIVGSSVLTTTGAADTVTIGLTAETDGQLIIGSTAGDPAWGNLASAGGTITVTDGANTINLEVNTALLGARFFTTDSGTATVAGSTVNVLGGTNINTAGAGNTVTVNLDANINVTSVTATDIETDSLEVNDLSTGFLESNATGVISNSEGTNGQLIIGSTGNPAAWANLTSAASTIEITEGANTINLESYAGFGSPYINVRGDMTTKIGGGTPAGASGHSGSSVFIICTNTTGANADIYSSTDAITWTLESAAAATTVSIDVHCGSNNDSVCCTKDNSLSIAGVWHSTNPTGTWTEYAVNASNPKSPTSVNFDGTYWMITCTTNAGADAIFYDSDPTSGAWTQNTTGITQALNDCAFGNSTWVIVGDVGYVAYNATDPSGAWTSVSAGFDSTKTGVNINVISVDYSPTLNLFCAVGTEGRIATSPDGITWTQRYSTAIIGNDFTSVHWDSTNNVFIAWAGPSTTAMYFSYNGILWVEGNSLSGGGGPGKRDPQTTLAGKAVVFSGSGDYFYSR